MSTPLVPAPDQDALDALDFAQRGRPDAEIGYSEDAPRLASEQLAEFEPASFRFNNRRDPAPIPSSAEPRYRNNQIIFEKTATELIVAAYDSGLLIVHGWTVSIALDDVKAYIQDFGRNAIKDVGGGFFFHDGQFVISHSGAKLTLTADEGTAIVKFVSDYYSL